MAKQRLNARECLYPRSAQGPQGPAPEPEGGTTTIRDEYPDGPYKPAHWPGWARDEIFTHVDVRFDWTDRLLILIGRTVTVKVQTVVAAAPGRCASTSSAWAHRIRWPWQKGHGGYAEVGGATPMTNDPQQQAGRTAGPARRFRIGMEPMARAVLAEQERDEAEAKLQAAEQRADAMSDVLERFADLGQLVLDRITNGVTHEERYLMKDTARIAMGQYRALGGAAGAQGAGES